VGFNQVGPFLQDVCALAWGQFGPAPVTPSRKARGDGCIDVSGLALGHHSNQLTRSRVHAIKRFASDSGAVSAIDKKTGCNVEFCR
jgi:hypothetical protein